jgi:hypothetical protein
LVFVSAILLTKTLSKSDLESLSAMAGGLGVVGKIFCCILNSYQKIMETLRL